MAQMGAVVLAAGQGTRMRSAKNKVLHQLLGRPLVSYALSLAASCCERVILVSGHQCDEVDAVARAQFADAPQRLSTVHQLQRLGTGHAVQQAEALAADLEWVLILYGDVPLLRLETVQQLIAAARENGRVAMLGLRPSSATGYGRLLFDAAGRVVRIVEERDCTDAQRTIPDVNAGIYCVRGDLLFAALRDLKPDNAQGEYYLTDVVAAIEGGASVVTVDPREVQGINTRLDLVAASRELQQRIHRRLALESGVTIIDPPSTTIEPDVVIGQDTIIGPGVSLRGNTVIGAGCYIDSGNVLTEMRLGDGVTIRPYCVLAKSTIGDNTAVGPFMHMREGTVVGRGAKLGNFVETKKARLADGVKAGHLSYLGDCELGAGVNVGAGTITCNYDGAKKHQTLIGANVFIGSNTELVAPVSVGENAYIGAGTTVTRDIPPGALAVSRVPQKNIEGYVDRKRASKQPKD